MNYKKTAKVIIFSQLFLAVFLFARYANAYEQIQVTSFFDGFFSMFTILPMVKGMLGVIFFVNLTKFLGSSNAPKTDIPRQLKDVPIITQYDPPEDLSPIEAGTIINRVVDQNDISSVIMDLALRGYIKIDYIEDINFIKIKAGDDLVNPADKEIFKLLFQYRNHVLLSTLKKQSSDFVQCAYRIDDLTKEYLYQNGYIYKYATSKFKKFEIIFSVLNVIFFFFVFILYIFLLSNINKLSDVSPNINPIVIFIVSILVLLIIGNIYRKMTTMLTEKGIEVYAKLLGFKKFLSMTEKDRLAFFNAPESKPEVIEKFLPYAMVLHVENKWSKVFEGLYKAKDVE